MAREKSSVKDIIINVLLLAAAGGILVYRYRDCKQKEAERDRQSEQAKLEQERGEKARQQKCLGLVKEENRNPCVQCMCRNCMAAFEACQKDPACLAMSPLPPSTDAGPAEITSTRAKFDARASCMTGVCFQDCIASK